MLNLKNGFMLFGRRAVSTAELAEGFVGQGLEVISSALRIKLADASLARNADGMAIKSGALKILHADGTASAADVTVSGMAVGDELVAVESFATKASIASVAMRTSEYAVGAGKLVKAAGTDETGNLLRITYLDRT